VYWSNRSWRGNYSSPVMHWIISQGLGQLGFYSDSNRHGTLQISDKIEKGMSTHLIRLNIADDPRKI